MAKYPKKYIKTLRSYLKFGDNEGMGIYEFNYNANAISAEEAMFDFESLGVPLPKECSNPELLKRYVLGKKWKDWHITEWSIGLKERTIFPQDIKDILLPKEHKKLIRNSYA